MVDMASLVLVNGHGNIKEGNLQGSSVQMLKTISMIKIFAAAIFQI